MTGFERGEIHPTAITGDVTIGENVTIGANTIIYDNVSIEDNTIIGPNCSIGEPLVGYYDDPDYINPPLLIGRNSLIRSGTTLYADSDFGDYLETAHGVIIRDQTHMGHHCRVGVLSVIQGHCTIGNYVRIHSHNEIGLKSQIRDFVWIFPYVILLNDWNPPSHFIVGPIIEDFVVIGANSIIYPGVEVREDSLVGAGSHVRKTFPPDSVIIGQPAKRICSIYEIEPKHGIIHPYPWRYRFDRGMPWEGIGYEKWVKNPR